ncbi:MAG: hypothetical protein QW416_01320 [Candidatus Nitrosocaldaceae archaeon]
MNSRIGASELISTIIIITVSIIASLSSAMYINSLAGDRMREHAKNAADIINKNNEDVIIVHSDYDNAYCRRALGIWFYNAGSIDSKIIKAVIDTTEVSLSQDFLAKATITVVCINYSNSGEHQLHIQLQHGNEIEYTVII